LMLASSSKLSMKVRHCPVLDRGTIYHNSPLEGPSQQDLVVNQIK
jgi:hypothetical protein